jgi:hypothetical protein
MMVEFTEVLNSSEGREDFPINDLVYVPILDGKEQSFLSARGRMFSSLTKKVAFISYAPFFVLSISISCRRC